MAQKQAGKQTSKISGFSGMALTARTIALVLAAALFVDRSAALETLTPRVGDMRFNVLQVFVFWADFLGVGFYICALWDLGEVFARLKRGDPFGPAMVRGLRGGGAWLCAGALAALLFAPSLARYARVPLEPDTLELKIVHTTFLLIGAAFLMLAQKGARLKSELDAFV
jgi:hypothetical protein